MSDKTKVNAKKKFQSSASLDIGIVIPPNAKAGKSVYKCPYCEVTASIEPVCWTLNHWLGRCEACEEIFYARVKYTGYSTSGSDGTNTLTFDILETYPKSIIKKHESIPKKIWFDYYEAHSCYEVNANKATVIMCRRTLQNVALERGAHKKDKGNWIPLKAQIYEAFPGAEFSYVRALADEIKYLGDYGAHPNDDGIDDVSNEDAKTMLDFTYSVLEIAYINPYRIKQRMESRKRA